jgi:hypothetical protein
MRQDYRSEWPLVKWKDCQGGWNTGRVVAPQTVRAEIKLNIADEPPETAVLVQHSCDGGLEWVMEKTLQPWPARDEWEAS